MRRGAKDIMSGQGCGEGTIEFSPILKGSDALRTRIARRLISPYQVALLVLDLAAVNLAMVLGLYITGLHNLLWEGFLNPLTFFILSFLVIGFFPSYHLYNYHYIFMKKSHILVLFKSFFWASVSFFILFFAYNYPHFLEGRNRIFFVLSAAVLVLLLSRFFWHYLTHLLTAMGISFLAIGIVGLTQPTENPVVLQYWQAIAIGVVFSFVMVSAGRYGLVHVVLSQWMRRRFRRQIAIVGSDEEAKRITEHIIDQNAPFWVTGFVSDQVGGRVDVSVAKAQLGNMENLPSIVEREKIDELIVTDEKIDKRTLISLLDYCTSEGVTVWFPPRLMPVVDMKLVVDSFCGLPMIKLCSQKNSWLFNKVKYGLDALVTLPCFLVLVPFFLLIGLIIKSTSLGPVFYRANAVGKNGRSFPMYKFRSMKVNNGNKIHQDFVTKLIKGEIRPDGENGQPLKVTNDPRVTPIGRFLRKSSLDELPQLINVLKGDMSLVGPRPCLPYEYDIYMDWHRKRLSVRPGITGLWQVAGRSAVAFEDMVLLDLYYIYNRSLIMDINILYETVFAVLEKRGAY